MNPDLVTLVSRRLRECPPDDGHPADLVARLVDSAAPLLDRDQHGRVVRQVLSAVVGLGPLQPLLDDPLVTDVVVNSSGDVWCEREGRLNRCEFTLGEDERSALVERALLNSGVTVDRAHPIADGRLADGSRVSVVLPPIVDGGPAMAIRRFRREQVGFASFGAATAETVEALVEDRMNLVIYGATGAGKTTLLEAMIGLVEPTERVVYIEDTPELRVGGHSLGLRTRRANNEGVGQVTMGALVRASLRLRPDRLVIGEVRGPEALDMVWALSSGHTGCLSTVHARSSVEAFARLETFCLLADVDLPLAAVRAQVHTAIDALVGVVRAVDGARTISAIDVVDRSRGDESGPALRSLMAHV